MSAVIFAVMFLATWLGMTTDADDPWVCAYHPPTWIDQAGVTHTQIESYMCVNTDTGLMVWGDAMGIVVGYNAG